jgi:TATA-binding protein-associated factor Taf7
MKLASAAILALVLAITTPADTAKYDEVANAAEIPMEEEEQSDKEAEQTKENLERMREIEIQQKSIHENLKELQNLVNDRCKKKKKL